METISPQATEDRLNRALRICASQASSLTGGGAALLYTHQPGDSLSGRLRAAAGFRSADEARESSAAFEALVISAIDTTEAQSQAVSGPLAARLSGASVHVIPLLARNRCVASDG